jgi:CRISPR-associated endonuclease Cas2
MSVLLVMYDLNNEGKSTRDYREFYKIIKSYDWARLSDSAYALNTEEGPHQVWSRLRPHTDADDDVLVVTLALPFAGVHRTGTIRWIQRSLPRHER